MRGNELCYTKITWDFCCVPSRRTAQSQPRCYSSSFPDGSPWAAEAWRVVRYRCPGSILQARKSVHLEQSSNPNHNLVPRAFPFSLGSSLYKWNTVGASLFFNCWRFTWIRESESHRDFGKLLYPLSMLRIIWTFSKDSRFDWHPCCHGNAEMTSCNLHIINFLGP